jgi:hypothetical protein
MVDKYKEELTKMELADESGMKSQPERGEL